MRTGRPLNRRNVLKSGVGLTALGTAGCLTSFGGSGGKQRATLSTPRLTTGSTSLVTPIIKAEGLDEKYDFKLDVDARASIYVSDYANGKYDVAPIGISHQVNLRKQGVESRLFTGFDLSSQFWVTNDESITSVADIEGKQVAAPLGSAGFALASALVKRETGKSVEELAGNLITAPGPVKPINALTAGNSDVALSWEPAITVFSLKSDVTLRRLMDVRQVYRDAFDADPFHLVWGVHKSVLDDHREAVRGLRKASAEANDILTDDVDTAVDLIVEGTENEPAPVRQVLEKRRLEYRMGGMAAVRPAIETQAQLYADLGAIETTPADDAYVDFD